MESSQHRAFRLVCAAVLVVAVVVVLSPCLEGGFLNWDDNDYVTENPLVQRASWESVGSGFTSLHAGHYFPLVLASYILDQRVGGGDPRVFHRTNLILHVVSTLLVFLLASSLAESTVRGLAVALLFGIHPAHVESVCWIAERKDVLYAPFYLGSLLAYLRYATAGAPPQRRSPRVWYALSVGLFACSLLSKAMAMTLPLVLLLLDHHLGRLRGGRVLLEKAPFFAAAAGHGALTLVARARYMTVLREVPYTLATVPLSAYRVWYYLMRLLLPVDVLPLHPGPEWRWAWTGSAAVLQGVSLASLAAAVAAVAIGLWRRRPWASCAAFFLVSLLPVLGITATGFFADRYTYLSSLGPFLVVAGATLPDGTAAWGSARRVAAVAIGAALVACLGFLARQQCHIWSDAVALWNRAATLYPRHPEAYYVRALALQERGNGEAALADLDRAERLGLRANRLYEMRGLLRSRLRDFAGAAADFSRCLDRRPDDVDSRFNRGLARFLAGDPAGAAQDWERVLQARPNDKEAASRLAEALARLRERGAGGRPLPATKGTDGM
jgi:Tfp pilus assembly protein PilF